MLATIADAVRERSAHPAISSVLARDRLDTELTRRVASGSECTPDATQRLSSFLHPRIIPTPANLTMVRSHITVLYGSLR